MTTTTEYETNNEHLTEPGWLRLVNRTVFVRATIVAVILGSVLTFINQRGWVFGRDPLDVLQLVLVFLLPFGVVTTAQIAGIRRAHNDSAEQGTPDRKDGFLSTAFSHGIPSRAVAIGLAFGSANAAFVLADVIVRASDFATISIVSLAQAYALPLVFALLSQAISYRRVRYQAVAGH